MINYKFEKCRGAEHSEWIFSKQFRYLNFNLSMIHSPILKYDDPRNNKNFFLLYIKFTKHNFIKSLHSTCVLYSKNICSF